MNIYEQHVTHVAGDQARMRGCRRQALPGSGHDDELPGGVRLVVLRKRLIWWNARVAADMEGGGVLAVLRLRDAELANLIRRG